MTVLDPTSGDGYREDARDSTGSGEVGCAFWSRCRLRYTETRAAAADERNAQGRAAKTKEEQGHLRFAFETCNFRRFRPLFSEFRISLANDRQRLDSIPFPLPALLQCVRACTLHLLPARRKKCRRRLSE